MAKTMKTTLVRHPLEPKNCSKQNIQIRKEERNKKNEMKNENLLQWKYDEIKRRMLVINMKIYIELIWQEKMLRKNGTENRINKEKRDIK